MNKLIIAYLALISILAAVITIIDKINAKTDSRRIPEDFLLTLGLLGGSLSEYITMKLIRHKTRHNKFMVGLPVLLLIQITIIAGLWIYTQRG
ncbi:hypothetical protein IMSAG250_00906 [Clostridiales bacterium]|mgnify:FL=1|nr:DUF1294 domain-containing protein [Eubacterium sp.]GFI71699.1 hypothetical protein IMSAG250_00906 [Clostridiales bacterium]